MANLLRNTAWTSSTSRPVTRLLNVTGGQLIVAFAFSASITSASLSCAGEAMSLRRRVDVSSGYGIGIWSIANKWSGDQTISLSGGSGRAELMAAVFEGCLDYRHNAYNAGENVTLNQEAGYDTGLLLGFAITWTTNVVSISPKSPLVSITGARSYNPDSRSFHWQPAWATYNGNATRSIGFTMPATDRHMTGVSFDGTKGAIFMVPPMPIGI